MDGGCGPQFRAKKRLGQNFLLDINLAQKIVSRLEVECRDRVMEIGPGQGALTKFLLELPAQIIAVEKDSCLAYSLKKRFPGLRLMVADALSLDWSRIDAAGIQRIIGNLPYNIASPLIWELVKSCPGATKMVFTLQKEVAQRLTACSGNRIYGALTVWVRNFARVKYEFNLGPQVFRPRPKVHSAVVSIQPRKEAMHPILSSALAELIHICFQQRRKQIKNVLKRCCPSDIAQSVMSLGLDPFCRPEDLSPQDFLALAEWLVQKKYLPTK